MSCKTVDASTAAAITAAIEQEGEMIFYRFNFQTDFDRLPFARGGTICSTSAVVTAIKEGWQKKIISFLHILCYQMSSFSLLFEHSKAVSGYLGFTVVVP